MKAPVRIPRLGLACAVALAAGLAHAHPCSAGFIGLGTAANYTLFDVRNTQFQFNNSFVGGDVGLGAGTTYNISGGGSEAITGNVFYSPLTPPTGFAPGVPTGSIIRDVAGLDQARLDAEAAAAMPGTDGEPDHRRESDHQRHRSYRRKRRGERGQPDRGQHDQRQRADHWHGERHVHLPRQR